MSGRPRRQQDDSDHLLLAAAGIALIAFGIALIAGAFTDAGEFTGYPLILAGVLVLILRSFHSRLKLVRLFNKVELGLVPGQAERGEPDSQGQQGSTPDPESQRPSLREVSRAARNPDTDRHRRR